MKHICIVSSFSLFTGVFTGRDTPEGGEGETGRKEPPPQPQR